MAGEKKKTKEAWITQSCPRTLLDGGVSCRQCSAQAGEGEGRTQSRGLGSLPAAVGTREHVAGNARHHRPGSSECGPREARAVGCSSRLAGRVCC